MSKQYVDQAGEFLCQVDSPGDGGWFSESAQKKTPYIRIPLTVIEDGPQKGKIIIWQGWLSDNAFDGTIKSLVKAFPEFSGDIAELDVDGQLSLEGLQCRIVVDSEQYTDDKGVTETRYKAQWLNPVDGVGGSGKPLESAKLKSLISKFARKGVAIAKAVRAESGASQPATTRTPPRTPAQSAPASNPPAGSEAPEDQMPY